MSSKPENEIHNDLMLSRASHSSPLGKSTEEVKARVPYEVKEGFARIAHELGMTESELLREMVTIKVLGLDTVRRLNEERLARVAANSHE